MTENSNDTSVPNLVTPNTERAVQDIIKSTQQSQLESKEDTSPQEKPPNDEANTQLQPAPPSQPARIPAPPGDDNFENLQRAVQILGKAKQLDEMKRFDDALKLYRQGVDMLLEELIIRQGTEQSRSYLRDKCNDFMNRIDQLKLIIQIEKASAENKENQTKDVVQWVEQIEILKSN